MMENGPCKNTTLMLHDCPQLEACTPAKPQGIMHDVTCATRTYKNFAMRKLSWSAAAPCLIMIKTLGKDSSPHA
jgi:hypothetical protein